MSAAVGAFLAGLMLAESEFSHQAYAEVRSVRDVLSGHDYPEPVALMLGEALAMGALLSGALEFDGVFGLQVKSDGPISLDRRGELKIQFSDVASSFVEQGNSYWFTTVGPAS